MKKHFKVFPIGAVRKKDGQTRIEIDEKYEGALLGLEGFSHINVYYWFHENDTPEKRGVLRVHPRKNRSNPLTGVFATHSPMRPNLIACTLCKIIGINGCTIVIDGIDALDGSPVIDIKCYIPDDRSFSDLRLPGWV